MNADDAIRLPTRDEVAFPCPDGSYAIEHFYGKTLEQAEQLFAEGETLYYTEDLLWMNPVGFRFYIQAAIGYCLSDRATGDPCIISALAGNLSHRQEFQPVELVPCARLLADFCRAVCQQFDRYDADPQIYCGLREKYEQLTELFTRIANEAENA